jgi:hypothetical protein
MMEIPTQKKDIILKEYGRTIQEMVEHILTIKDKDMRTKQANSCIEMMRILNPEIKETQEHYTKLWDQLYIISNFQLDVDSPYPMPERAVIGKKPNHVDYNSNKLYYKHYGKNIQLLIERVMAIEDPQVQEDGVIYLGRTMKKFYTTWNKDNVDDDLIITHISEMSKGKLTIDSDKVKSQHLFDIFEKIKAQGIDNNPISLLFNTKKNTPANYAPLYEGKSNSEGGGNGGGTNRYNKSGGNNQRSNRPSNGGNSNGGSSLKYKRKQ